MKRSMPLFAGLLGLATVSFAAVDIDLTIDFAGQSHAIELTDAGYARARRVMREALGSRYQRSRSWELITRLFDPTTRGHMEAAAGLSSDDASMRVSVNPADSVSQIYPGERLQLPDGTEYVVRRGDTLGRIARRNDATLDQMREENEDRFEIWPHKGTETLENGTERPIVRFGETHMRTEGWTTERFDEVLVHESAHAGDTNTCRSNPHQDYGHDQNHSLREILSPRSAFTEGWANYRSVAIQSDSLTNALVTDDATELPTLITEDADGAERVVPCWDLTVREMISNEAQVGRVLYRMAHELSTGAAGVDAAFLLSSSISCRSLPDLIGKYVEAFPHERRALKLLLLDHFGETASASQVVEMLGGRMPTIGDRRAGRIDYGWLNGTAASERPEEATCDAFEAFVITASPSPDTPPSENQNIAQEGTGVYGM